MQVCFCPIRGCCERATTLMPSVFGKRQAEVSVPLGIVAPILAHLDEEKQVHWLFQDTCQFLAGLGGQVLDHAAALAQHAVQTGNDKLLEPIQRCFLYMPYMHSESLAIHEQSVRLFGQPGLEFQLDYEFKHKAIIERFGRYPHRNQILGRQSTPEELEFLKQPGSSF